MFALLFADIAGRQQAGIVLAAEAADTVQKDQASEETKDADGAAAQEAKDTAVQAKVRVAFPTQEGMSYIGHSGKVTGYNYDYLEKVSEYTGLEMDYVAYPSDDGNEAVGNAHERSDRGEGRPYGAHAEDGAGPAAVRISRAQLGTVYTTLCALVSSDFREHNLKDHNSFRVGLWEQAQVRNSEVLAYLESGRTCRPRSCIMRRLTPRNRRSSTGKWI